MRPILLSLLTFLPIFHALAIPTDGLVHHFQLDQSLNSSSTPLTTLTSPGVAPQYGTGHLSTDFAADIGGGRYLTVTTNFTEHRTNNTYTVSAWFKPDLAPSGSQRFFVFETSPDYTVSLGLREGADTSDTKVQFFTQTTGNNSLNISTEIPDREITARWHHGAVTFDGTTLTAYIDGESIGSLNLSGQGDLKDVTALNIGTYRSANGRFFDGLIDEVAVWNLALSASEIKDLSDETATIHYVNGLNVGNDAAPYNSWNTAAVDLQDALSIARPGDEIWVAQGTYYPDQGGGQSNNDRNATFTLKNRVAIYGGFSGDETSTDEADPSAHPTILSGDIDQNNGSEDQRDFSKYTNNSYNVLTAEDLDSSASLTGLTIRHGNADGVAIADSAGGGLYCKNASPSLSNITFEANVARSGGAISCEQSSPSIDNCSFQNNTARDAGALAIATSSYPTITNCVFDGNLALVTGGAIVSSTSIPFFNNCAFYGNTSDIQGGVFYNYDSNTVLTNCTLSGNSSGREGGALYNANTSFPKLRNSIIWNNEAAGVTNTAAASIHNEDGSATVASYSLVENISKATLNATGTDTNLEPNNPLFLSATQTKIGDFQLRTSSPAIDAGSNVLNSSLTDLDGNNRIQNSTIDLGAIEGGQEILRLYVNASNAANAATPYDTWGTAAATLQDALASSQPGDEIWVAQGTYYPDEGGSQTDNDRAATFTLDNDIALYGGFTGNETERAAANPRANETILSGDIDQNDGPNFANTASNATHVLVASGDALLDGFTVTGGNADAGDSPTYTDSSGAGLNIQTGSTVTVSNCSFHSNQAVRIGGAIENKGGTLTMTNTSLQGNRSDRFGGGISISGGTTILTNCLITGNEAETGGGCDIYEADVTLTNCTIHGNNATAEGGGIFNEASTPRIQNSIIWNNQAAGVTNASIHNKGELEPIYQFNLDASDDPLFVLEVDPATAPTTSGDLRLRAGSPAINHGEADLNEEGTDIAGNDRLQENSIDAGAYETPFTEIVDWEIDTDSDAIDPTSLSASFTLDSGSLPADWKDSVTVVTTGTASFNSRSSTLLGGTIYTLFLDGLTGEGSYSLTFDKADIGNQGFILEGGASITFQRHTSTTPIHYVDARNDEDERAPYNTWGKAATSLQDVLEIASPGDEIWVAAGTYYPDQGLEQTDNDRNATFQLKNGVALYGGFSGNETDRADADPQTNETILSGNVDHDDTPYNNSYHVVTARDINHTAILQGFTIQDGYAEITDNDDGNVDADGGGLLIDNAFPRIKSCVFQSNQAADNGGGIAIKGDAANQAITDCVFIENTAFNGGAIHIAGKGLADFVGCVFKENSAHYGGAIDISGETSPHTWNCTFQGNHANNGGGAISSSTTSHYTVGNCLFQGNQVGDYGGAVIVTDGSPRFVNSTFQGNQTANKGGAIAILTELEPTFENCIIWNNQANGVTNTPNASIHVEASSTPTYSHCLVENYAKDDLDSSGTSPDTNLIPADPHFILEADPANAPTTTGDLRLRAGSPAIDRGLNSANITTTDLAGNTRTQNTTIDLGSYEFTYLTINSWTLDTPEAIDATSLSTTLTLSKALPTGWEAALTTSATGTAAASGLEVIGSGPVYTITLTGLSGEGRITIQLDTSSQVFLGNTITGTSARTVARYSSASPTHYVNAANAANAAAPYDSWATAASDLQDALEFAQSGDEIWVAKGTYYPDEGENQTENDRHATFNLKNGVALYGGFIGNETDRASAAPGANETILSGDIDQDDAPDANSYNVLTAKGLNDSAKLQGFTIQGGNADHPDQELQTAGAGLLCDTSDPIFTNCIFRDNQAVFGGVAVFISNSTPVFTNCAFYGNNSESEGGALYNDDSSPVLINCTLFGNIAGREGGAIYNDNSSHPELTNTIVWNNQADDGTNTANASVFEQGGSSTIYSNSLVGGYLKSELDASGSSPDTNVATSDPFFQSAENGDLSLSPASPAIDTGDNTANTTTTDLGGNARIQNTTIDLGAYEFSPYTEAPVIVLNGDAEIILEIGTQWIDPGATATDQEGNPLTVTTNESFPGGKVVVTYDAVDSFGNQAIQVTRTVTFVSLSTPPTISLNGDALTTVPFGGTWSDPGATATDSLGEPVTVTTGGDTVDTTQANGVFTITYDATDSRDNVALQVTRTVKVVGNIDFDPDSNNTLDQLAWTDGWVLQTSTDLKTWIDVPDAQSPFQIPPITEAKRFWRLRKAD